MRRMSQSRFWLKHHKGGESGGFSLLEVTVAVLVMTIAGVALLSFMVYATGMSVKSQQQSYGLRWIQEDAEQVKAAATNWTYGTLSNNAGILQLSGCSTSDCGLASGNLIRLRDSATLSAVTVISSNTVTLTPTPTLTPGSSTSFVPVNQCMATTPSDGLATAFATALPTLAPVPTTNYVWKGTTYALTRGGYSGSTTPTVSTVAPFNILQITYQVAPVSGPGQTFVMSTEILPSATLQCP